MPDFIEKDIRINLDGKTNPSGLKPDMFWCMEDSVIAIPPRQEDSNQLSAALTMRTAVAAAAGVTAVAAGKFARLRASDVKSKYKAEAIIKDNCHCGFKVSVELHFHGRDAVASADFQKLANRNIRLLIPERAGTMVFIEWIRLAHSHEDEPRGYVLKGEVEVANEPPYYTFPIPV